MKRHTILSIVAALATLIATGASAQRSEGHDSHRTRLIPYPTASEAAKQSLAKQRYMQPITEWATDSEGALNGEFTYPFSWVERQIFVRVEGVNCPYEVLVNGKSAGSSANGHAATEFNITKISVTDLLFKIFSCFFTDYDISFTPYLAGYCFIKSITCNFY